MDSQIIYGQESQDSQNFMTDFSNIDYLINEQWVTGFKGQIDITNRNNSNTNGWTLEFEFDGAITDIWNADIVSRNGDNYVITNKDYNASVRPNEEITIGFIAEGSTNEKPESFEFNSGETGNSLSRLNSDNSSNGGSSSIDYLMSEQWENGFKGQIDITNRSNNNTDGWTLEFEFDGEITDIWNADIVSRNGNSYVITNKDYNASVNPNEKITVGFIAEGSTNDKPESFQFSGLGTGNLGFDSDFDSDADSDANPTFQTPSEPDHNFGGGGQTYDIKRGSVVNNFDLNQDKINFGNTSIHNHIPVQTDRGLVIRFIWDTNNSDHLFQGVNLKDLRPENFSLINDNHQRQDVSMVIAWENGSAPVRGDAVYVLGHQEGREQEVEFDPQNQVLSMMYLNIRDNVIVEETDKGVKFTVLPTGQSTTLLGATFGSLNGVTVEARPGQLEDDFLGRMGFSSKVSNINVQTYSREGIPVAGIDEPNGDYLYRYPAYRNVATGTSGSHFQFNSGNTTNFVLSELTQDDSHNHEHHNHGGEHNYISMSSVDSIDLNSEDSLNVERNITGQGEDFALSSGGDYDNSGDSEGNNYDLSIEEGHNGIENHETSDLTDSNIFGEDNQFDHANSEIKVDYIL